ncbi:DMT family transporter [Xanthobacter aminoxidans]|uniref:DMT family transporter n=1 Tax=Xanthobacter aminoxidans TaxID=186280 RepID=UPI003728D24A
MAAPVTEVAIEAKAPVSAILALLATALLWGSNHAAARAIHDALPLPSLIFWRWAIALVLLLPIALPGLLRERAAIRRNAGRIALLGLVGVGLFSGSLYAGAYLSPALEVGLLNATTPIWVLLIATVVGRTRPQLAQIGGILIAMAGVTLVLMKGLPTGLAVFHFGAGNLCSITAAVLFAFYTYSLGQNPIGISALSLTALTALAGFVLVFCPVYAVFLLLGGQDPFTSGLKVEPVTLTVLYIAAGPTLLGNLFWIYGAARVGAARAGPFLYFSPLATVALSATLLGEAITPMQMVGGAAILSGLWISTQAGAGPRRPAPRPSARPS